ncbi:MAG: glycosyltransferase family 4 protein, partial [Calditrichota bacterium]
MKIAYIAAGAAGMYCGSCIRDNTLAKALIARGHDVALIPTYTPLRTDEPGVAIEKVFYNGISVYLEQKFAWLRSGRFNLDKILNSSRVLNYLSKVNASTNAKDLGELTVSMLKGEDGNQALELEKLVTWLRDEYKPDLVQITNSMLAGLAKRFKQELKVPVLCALQGEDIFLDDLLEPYKTQAMQLLRQKVLDCDALVATSTFYADYMSGYLNVPREKIHVVKLGLNLEGHGVDEISRNSERLTIGYLARICPEKGLHILLDAFAKIRKEHTDLNVCLKAAGYLGARDEAPLNRLHP